MSHRSAVLSRILVFLVTVAFLNSGCSVRPLVISFLSESFTGLEDLYRSENDPELVRESLPANLKLLDLLILQSPGDENLLLAASQAYTTYGYAFIMRDAEKIMDRDVSEWRRLKQRARKHFVRAKEYAFRALDIRHPGFSESYRFDPRAALQGLSKEDVPLLYWAAAAWANFISASLDDPSAIVDLPQVGGLLERALQLDESYDRGALHEMMVSYSAGRPDGTDAHMDTARWHFRRALELSQGGRASLFVAYAQAISVRNQDREEFLIMLDRALAVDVDANPRSRLANLLAQDRAMWLKGRVGVLFY
ncbi:MAG: TRAP transporter TatT component family protein [Fidelibacterota bacterium]